MERRTSAKPDSTSECRSRPRIALYSHDALGLGHLRRNLLLAQTLAQSSLSPNVLTISGASETKLFTAPRGVDSLTLPALRKHSDGRYDARSLDISLDDLATIRAATIRAAMTTFQPDVFIADKVPQGALGELMPTLADLRERGRTACVLGLRDILDDPDTVRREWGGDGYERTIADYYDAVWVYGDRRVYDVVKEYGFGPEVAAKIRYTGYFDRFSVSKGAGDPAHFKSGSYPDRYVLCLLGGGQDGGGLAEAFMGMQLPPGLDGVILGGPFLSQGMREMLRRVSNRSPRLHFIDFSNDPSELIRRAEKVIAMGGYNTLCEVLCFERPTLIVPRVSPRSEQLIRARRLAELGVVDYLPPAEAKPTALLSWVEQMGKPPVRVRDKIDFDGLGRMMTFVEELLSPLGCAAKTAAN